MKLEEHSIRRPHLGRSCVGRLGFYNAELELMTPGGVAGWKQQVWWAGGNGNQIWTILHALQHDHLAVSSSFLKNLPLKIS